MSFSFGDICLIRFPFTDAIGVKKRPALLLATDAEGDGIFLRITTKLGHSEKEVSIEKWRESGLLAPSCIRTGKFATLNLSLIEKKLGSLAEDDRAALLAALAAWVEHLGTLR